MKFWRSTVGASRKCPLPVPSGGVPGPLTKFAVPVGVSVESSHLTQPFRLLGETVIKVEAVQAPLEQASPVVQMLLSLQLVPFGAITGAHALVVPSQTSSGL